MVKRTPEKNYTIDFQTKDFEKIFSYLLHYLPQEIKIVVWVSWWPDSMFLAYTLQQYYMYKWRQQENIIIAHYNHWQRKESHKELMFLQKYFAYNTFYWNLDIPKKWLWETKLRESRHKFFQEVLKDSWSSYLFLWHNFSDRIETTLMNITRGASLKGFLWIKSYEYDSHTKHSTYRPLISLSKKSIQEYCDIYSIPYFIDTTNAIPNNPRNILRNTIIPQRQNTHTWWDKNRQRSWESIYISIENLLWQKTHSYKFQQYTPHKRRWVEKRYSIDNNFVIQDILYDFFSQHLYTTKKKVENIYEFIVGDAEWYMYIWWWSIYKTQTVTHLLQWPKKFWEKLKKDKKQPHKKITHSWLLQFDGNIYSIQEEWIGLTIRYPLPWDIYKQKKLIKVLWNKKIPLFMRYTVPVIASWSHIVAILD